MFNFIGNITKAVVKTAVAVPIAVVADVVTLGGTINGEYPGQGSYTGDTIDSISNDFKKSLE